MEEKEFPISLARKTISSYIREGKIISSPHSPKEFQRKSGVFVSLHKKGRLRGCIGTFLPTQKSIAEEIIKNTISAATQDPRFPPVEEKELLDLEVAVDVLNTPELVKSKEDLDPRKYGVIVRRGWQRGLLLPDLEGVDTTHQQLEIVKQKAGLSGVLDEELEIHRFTVTRYKETA